MSDPTYGSGRARPEMPSSSTRRMPSQDPYYQEPPQREPERPETLRVSAGRLWAGGVGAAVVVALVLVVGIMLVRGILNIPVLSPEGEGTYGSASTTTFAVAGAIIALLATGLLHGLLLFMPKPVQFFYWICGLITAVAVLLPFTFGAEMSAQIATAAIDLVAGIALMAVLGSIGTSALTDLQERQQQQQQQWQQQNWRNQQWR